ncbi:DNA repair protein rad2 [Dipsacomyces acuminosporus]|nr:DNA repair protein rad2 [Dipsacomyces acuminosporus]
MGVKGLWTLLEPSARPVRLESLARKRLAVDASIWLYQLFKAMRDSDGNPLEEVHILGFYRRVCKLLYYDIQPVFVFDGAAPELKRATVAERQSLKESKTRDAKRAAQQLLQTQLKLQALNGAASGSNNQETPETEAQAVAPDSHSHSPSPLKKRKRDEYELPPIQSNALSTRAANENDMRMAHPEDLHQLINLASRNPSIFGNMDDIDIDIDSAEFKALSPEDQHDLIVALKVRSRQTSHGRLQQMLESSDTALDFSKQQIDMLVKRNNLTQQWLQVTGAGHRMTSLSSSNVSAGRVASERNREYMLIKSDQPGGGWTLRMGGSHSPAVAADADKHSASNEYGKVVISSDVEEDEDEDEDRSEGEDEDDDDGVFEDVAHTITDTHTSPYPHTTSVNAVDNNAQDPQRYWGSDTAPAVSVGNTNPLARSGLGHTANAIHISENTYESVQPLGYTGNGNGNGNEGRRDFGFQDIPMAAPASFQLDDLFDDEDKAGSESVSVLTNNDAGYVEYDDSNSDAAVSIYSSQSDVDAEILALYGDYEQLELLQQRQEEETRKQQEREEEAILAMSAQDFLKTWLQLVSPPILQYDPAICDNMRYWLVDAELDALKRLSWRASRQLEKQPDIDMGDYASHEDGAIDLTVDEHLLYLRTRIAHLSLLSNYLSFALRWRQRRGSAQVDTAHTKQTASPDSVSGKSISDTSIDSARDIEASIPLASSTLLTKESKPRASSTGGCGGGNGIGSSPVLGSRSANPVEVIIDADEDTDVRANDQEDALRKRDLVFAKAELLATAAVAGEDREDREGGSATKTGNPQAGALESRPANAVRNIDSDSEDSDSAYDVGDGEQIGMSILSAEQDVSYRKPRASSTYPASVSMSGTPAASEIADADVGGDIDDEDDMDGDAMKQSDLMRSEQNEYALFVDKLKASSDDLGVSRGSAHQSMRIELERELQALRSRVRDNKRDSSGIDSDMVEDARMLLTLFGIPYITAPMEAEAQCAAMISLGLVDGMITDDSDAFLFAPSSKTHVYRHFFQKDRFVEMYSGDNIYQDSSLSRRDFIFLAYLLGSDYTVGIKGIGPVLAMEALAEFGPSTDEAQSNSAGDEEVVLGALRRFRTWCDAVGAVLPGSSVPEELVGTPQRRRLASVVSKADIPSSFPDPRVVHAYFNPRLDDSGAKLEWGLPNLDLLRQFIGEKLGWSAAKTDETLVPLIRKMLENKPDSNSTAEPGRLDSFVSGNGSIDDGGFYSQPDPELAKHTRSKRIGRAISSRKKPLLSRKSLF